MLSPATAVVPARDYCAIARAYARKAIAKKNRRRFGIWIRLAAQRFLDDLARARKPDAPFYFDEWHATDACDFIEKLPHIEGSWFNADGSRQLSIVLHEAQVFFLVNLFGFRAPDGVRRFTTALFAVARKNAKALALDTPIPTPDGWRAMADVVPGSFVIGADGAPTMVVAESETFVGRACYRVSFSDGTSVVASADHRWVTRHRARPWAGVTHGRPVLGELTTEQIAASLRIARSDGVAEFNHSIARQGAARLPDRPLPFDPYLLGAWLGDGTTAVASLTCGDADVEHFAAAVARVIGAPPVRRRDKTAWRIGLTAGRGGPRGSSLQHALRELGLLGAKHIPDAYLWAGTDQRRALLQGLMDTDGSVSATGRSGALACTFVSTCRPLADGVLQLARSLGLKATIAESVAMLHGRAIGPRWLVQFTAWAEDRVFQLERKARRLQPRPAGRRRSDSIQIVGCELVPSVPTKCITVAAPDGMFLAGPGMTPTHNSTLAAGIGLYCETCEDEVGPQVVSAATTGSQARIVFNVAAAMAKRTADLREAFQLGIFSRAIACYQNGGSFKPINAKASTQDGLNPSCTILDELHAHKTHDLLNVLKSAAGARRQALFLYLTTEGYTSAGPWEEEREFAKKVLRGLIEADHYLALYFSVDEADQDLGTLEDDDFDEEAWHKANPLLDSNPLLLSEMRKLAIEAREKPSTHAEFKIKRVNRPASVAHGWVNLTRWRTNRGAVDLEALRGLPCWGGLDLSSTTDLTSFRLVWQLDAGRIATIGWRWVPQAAIRQRTQRGLIPYAGWVLSGKLLESGDEAIDYGPIEQRVIECRELFNLRGVQYDGWNASQSVQRLKAADVPMVQFIQGPRSYHPAMQALEVAYLNGLVAHDNDPVLNWNMSNLVSRKDVNGNNAPDKRKSTEKIDDACALLMGLGGCIGEQEPEPEHQIYVM